MSCPDINLFIDQLEEGALAPQLKAHLDGCVACQERIWILQALPAVMRPDLAVAERTIQRGMAGVLAAQRIEVARSRRWAVAGTLVLGFFTAVGTVLFTGAEAGAGPDVLGLYALAVALGAGAFRWRELRHLPAPCLAPTGPDGD